MAEIETSKKRRNKFTDILKMVAAAAGGVGSSGVGSIIVWGGGLAVATAITAFSIKKMNKKSVEPRKRAKNNCSKATIRVIEDECINGFRLALHNPSPAPHQHAWSTVSLSRMETQGQEIVSTQYLISGDKIVLQVEWRHETTASSKDEVVIFDNLHTRKITSTDDTHSRIHNLEQSALQLLASNDFSGKDPLGTIIRTIKDHRKVREQIASAKQASGGIEEHENGHGSQVEQSSGQIEEYPMEEKETERVSYGDEGNEETSEEGSAFIPIGGAKVGTLQQNIYRRRMQIWVFLVVVVMLILLASPKLLTN